MNGAKKKAPRLCEIPGCTHEADPKSAYCSTHDAESKQRWASTGAAINAIAQGLKR